MKLNDDFQVCAAARTKLTRLHDLLEDFTPGLISGCHITGSIALGDGRADKSDLDLVLVRSTSFSVAEAMQALERALADLRNSLPSPRIDGLVLTEADLRAGPDRIAGERSIVSNDRVQMGTEGGCRNPVTWQTLRQCGITAWGAPIDPERLWSDPARLESWTRENIDTYWRLWLARTRNLASRFGVASLGDGATEWGVLGVTRLHYTLATGQITSKYGAGCHALAVFDPAWHPIVNHALHLRAGSSERTPFRTPFSRRRAMQAYIAMVIEDALTL